MTDPVDPPPNDRPGSLDGDFATDPWQGEALLGSDAPFGNPDPAAWTLAAGNHVLRITLREDGVGLDKLVFQEATLPAPSGEGPPASALGCCGDSVTAAGEQCDDGNFVPGDGCSELCQNEAEEFVCSPIAVDGCLSAGKARLTLSEKKAGKEKWTAKLSRFDGATAQADLGGRRRSRLERPPP